MTLRFSAMVFVSLVVIASLRFCHWIAYEQEKALAAKKEASIRKTKFDRASNIVTDKA